MSSYLKFEQNIKTSPANVYHAFTNATLLRQWICDIATVEPKVGGRIYLAWNAGYYTAGEYSALENNQRVAFTWFGKNDPQRTQVEVSLHPTEMGTHLELTHSKIGEGNEWEVVVEEYKRGWKNSLKNLAYVMETGQDLRLVMRPMLGITINDFNEIIAQQIGVPVSKGIRIDDVTEGIGAQVAGLQHDDVIVALNGQTVEDWVSLNNALLGLQAGDVIPVVFYRGSEKKNVEMELSKRALPEIPESIIELSQALEKQNHKVAKQFDEFLDNVTEEEASFKPAPDEWSVKDIFAHLIQGERFYQFYITELVADQERWSDDWGGNMQAFIDATVESYGTLQNLRQELKRARKETVLLIAKLPPETVEHKSSYWRLAYNVLEMAHHDMAHLQQMRTAVQVSRAKG